MKVALSIADELFESAEVVSKRLGISPERAAATSAPAEPAVVVERAEIWWLTSVNQNSVARARRSSDAFNRSRLGTTLALVLTSDLRLLDAPGNVLLPAKASGLPGDSIANLSQINTIDRDSLTERVGHTAVHCFTT
jgi:mRNA interferase MazF